MHIHVALYGAARVVIGQSHVDISFDAGAVTLGQVLESMIATYPRARPYLLDEAGTLPPYMRVLINNTRPDPDVTLATALHDEDRVSLLVAVAGGELSRLPAHRQLPARLPLAKKHARRSNKRRAHRNDLKIFGLRISVLVLDPNSMRARNRLD